MDKELNFLEQKKLLINNRKIFFNEIEKHLLRELIHPDIELNQPEYYIKIKKTHIEKKPTYGTMWIPFTYNKIPGFSLDIKYSLYISGPIVRVGFFIASDGQWILQNPKLFSEWFLTGINQIWFQKEATHDLRGTGSLLIEWVFEMGDNFYNNYEANEQFIINFRHMHLRICELANSYCRKRKDMTDKKP